MAMQRVVRIAGPVSSANSFSTNWPLMWISSRYARLNGRPDARRKQGQTWLQTFADGQPVGEAGDDHGQFGGFDRFGDMHSKTRGQRLQSVFRPPERRQGDGRDLI